MSKIKLKIFWKLLVPRKFEGKIPRHGGDGQALVELLVTLAIASVLLPGLITGLFASREGKAQEIQRLDATALLREAGEALRVVREAGWSGVSTNGTYHPEVQGASWTLASGSESINGYTRYITISDAYRDANGNIVSSGGTADPSTKKAVITVSWSTPYSSEVTSTTYLTRYLNNATFIDTTEADFNAGLHSGTVTVNDNGGEVVLGAGGNADWCEPADAIVEELDYTGVAEARAITVIERKAFTGTGQNASGLPFAQISISDTNPPVAEIIGTFTDVSPPKSNDVFGEEDFAYIATDSNTEEIIVIDLTTTPYTKAGYFNPSGNNRGMDIFVVDNVGHMTTSSGSTFRTFDLTSKSGSRPQLGQVTLAGQGNSIYVRGDYAYVAVESSSTQFQIINVSSPASPQILSSLSLTNVAGRDVYVNEAGTRAYVATAYSAGNPEFFIIDITNKSDPFVVAGGRYDAGAMSPTGIRVVPGGRAIVVGESGGERYQVVNINNENSPIYCGGLNVAFDIYGIDAVLEEDGDAYSYIVTAESNAEFKIIEGGPGGQFSTIGDFTSGAFDATSSVAFNRFIPNFIEPAGTSLEFQVAAAAAVDGACTNALYHFLGPDGTSDTFFATSSAIPLLNNGQGYVNPGQCFKYRAFFSTSDPAASPILNDVTVNYSP